MNKRNRTSTHPQPYEEALWKTLNEAQLRSHDLSLLGNEHFFETVSIPPYAPASWGAEDAVRRATENAERVLATVLASQAGERAELSRQLKSIREAVSGLVSVPHQLGLLVSRVENLEALVLRSTAEVKEALRSSQASTTISGSLASRALAPELDALERRASEGRDLPDAAPWPSPKSLARTREWLGELRSIVESRELWWRSPHVTFTPEGDVELQWWLGTKTLAVYFGDETSEYIKAWGPNINEHMEDGQAEPASKMAEVWKWLSM